MSSEPREVAIASDVSLGLGLVLLPIIALFGFGFGWSEALRYAREQQGDAGIGTFVALAILAFVAFGFCAALVVRRQRLALLATVPLCLWLATVVPFQAQAVHEPGCSSYTGTEDPPTGELHDGNCEMSFAMGASAIAVGETVLFAIGLGTGALVTQYRGRERRSGARGAS